MTISIKTILWYFLVLLAILVALIPLSYIKPDINAGYLELKDRALLQSLGWQIAFNAHIFSGSIAIAIGWVQFNQKLFEKRRNWHRNIGKVYVLAGLICALSGMYVGYYATGGPVAAAGFITVAIIYFYTTLNGYLSIREKRVAVHQTMMFYSYAACLAAVSLRIYVPLLTVWLGDYLTAYRITAWLSWMTNLAVARILIHRKQRREIQALSYR